MSNSTSSTHNKSVVALATVTALAVCAGAYVYFTREQKKVVAGKKSSKKSKKSRDGSKKLDTGSAPSKIEVAIPKPKEVRKPISTPLELGREQGALGASKFKQGDLEGARGCYLRALNFFPESYKEERKVVYLNLAAVEEKLGKRREVVGSCSHALRIDPNSTKALARRARAYDNLGEKAKAAGDYALILLIDSNSSNPNNKLTPAAFNSISASLDKITSTIGETEASTLWEQKQKERSLGLENMPSAQFITTYLFSFSGEAKLFNRDESTREGILSSLEAEAKKLLAGSDESKLPLLSQVTEGDLKALAKNQVDRAVALKYLKRFEEAGVLVQDLVDASNAKDLLGEEYWANCCDVLGTLFLVCSDNKQAEVFLAKSVEANSGNLQAILRLAAVRLELGDLEGSNKCYDDATTLVENGLKEESIDACNVADYHFHVAQRAMISATPDLEVTQEHMQAAVDAVPDFVFAHLQLGITKFQASKHDEAVEILEKSCELAPELSQAHTYLGEVLCTLGRMEEAGKKFDDAIAVDPDAANAYVNKGVMLTADSPTAEKNKEALRLYQTAIQRDPKSEMAYVRTGLLFFNMGNYKLALKNFDTAIELANSLPDLVMFCQQRANCLARIRALQTYQNNVIRAEGYRVA